MTCGCQQSQPGEMIRAKSCTLPVIQSERAAMCLTCACREGTGSMADTCGVTGMFVATHILGKPCPRGRHPDAKGLVSAFGVKWRGVPMVDRVWLRATGQLSSIRALPQCGCWHRAKTFVEFAHVLIKTNLFHPLIALVKPRSDPR